MRNIYLTFRCLIIITILTTVIAYGITGCDSKAATFENDDEPCFAIYLVNSGELVLSDHHIEAYRRGVRLYEDDTDTHVIELNEEGIEKWNSYMTYESTPELTETLYKRDFVLKIEGEEIYRGKFYSMISSIDYGGVVILDALVKLDNDHNYIRINWGYPTPGFATGEDPRNSTEVIDCLEKRGFLK